ncbi:MAG: DUF1287 domain-containing protein [Hyphomicrobiaceae bacterium]
MVVKQHRSVTLERRRFVQGGVCLAMVSGLPFRAAAQTQSVSWGLQLVNAARSQIGVTIRYDGAYASLKFPGGDIPREVGVCTDVIIRAYRDAFDYDLQLAVNTDMSRNFGAYPRKWSLRRPDRNIDHRRVPNLQTFFRRKGAALGAASSPESYQPGDLVTQMISGRLPHIGIVSDRRAASGRFMLIHNIGAGAQEEDVTASFPVTGHYRFKPPKIS